MYVKEFLIRVVQGYLDLYPKCRKSEDTIRTFVLTTEMNDEVEEVYVLMALSYVVFQLNTPLIFNGSAIDWEAIVQALSNLQKDMDPKTSLDSFLTKLEERPVDVRIAPLVAFIKTYQVMRKEILRMAELYHWTPELVRSKLRPIIPDTTFTLSDIHPLMLTSKLTHGLQ